MMSEHRPDRKITLEDLLRVKRAERPPADFWTEFERELRTRQLAAAVEKKRWWYGLPKVFGGFTRYQLPVGAAAVFVVTFLTLREYRDPASAIDVPATAEQAPVPTVEDTVVTANDVVELAVVEVSPRPARQREYVPEQPAATPDRALSPLVPWTAGFDSEGADRELSPSERSIAANLAAAEPELTRVLGRSAALRLSEANQREPLAQMPSPRDQRRQRLFAYDPQLAGYSAGANDVAPQRVASRLDESELYESVRRLSGEGDRLTLKF